MNLKKLIVSYHNNSIFCEYKREASIRYLFIIQIICNVVKIKWRYEAYTRGSAGYARKAPSLFLGPLNKPIHSIFKYCD